MEFVRLFQQIGKGDSAIAGGKGASLGEMIQAGLPVPPGYIILSGAFDIFIAESKLNEEMDAALHDVNREEMHTVEKTSEKIQGLILAAKMPDSIASEIQSQFVTLGAQFVAVRSSATAEDSSSAAWAGQLDTFLNTTEENLLQNVQKCWASLFTPRAIFYRFEKGMHDKKISVAVVVQKMIQSEVSGIAFSVHPVTEDRNQMIIEAGFGLGEAIVSGQITPDSYVIEKEPRRVIDINITTQTRALVRGAAGPSTASKNSPQAGSGQANEWRDLSDAEGSKPTLNDKQMMELAELILRIEKHYGFPCDIEWAMEAGTFYITQSRPITTLSAQSSATEKKSTIALSNIFTRERPLFYFCIWDRSDRQGMERFMGERIQTNLFLVPTRGKNGEVRYSMQELHRLMDVSVDKINASGSLRTAILQNLKDTWTQLAEYFENGKKIKDAPDMMRYFNLLVQYWSSLDTPIFNAQDRADLDADFKKAVDVLRTETQEYTEAMSTYFIEFFEQTFPDIAHVSYFVTPEDVEALALNPKNSELIAALNVRAKEGCFMLNGNVRPMSELEDTLRREGLEIEHIQVHADAEIKGATAFPGKVKGPARVVNVKSELSSVLDGEVLVTLMTDPDFVPYMHKAIAFVTDEGGVMSHTAIVAREMKKPCVIGTKLATKVLKTGDMVEVDADNGIVRILERV